MSTDNKSYQNIPIFLCKKKEVDIIGACINFIKLISLSDLGSFRANPQFGFLLMDYEFVPDLPIRIKADLHPEIQNKYKVEQYVGNKIEFLLFDYLPEAKEFIESIKINFLPGSSTVNSLYYEVEITIILKPFDSDSGKQLEEYRISLNGLRKIQ